MIVGAIAIFLAKLPVLSLVGWEHTGTEMVAPANGIVPGRVLDVDLITTLRAPTTLDWTVQSGLDLLPLLAGWILALPFHVFGHQASVVDNLLIWVGGWLLVASPTWFWLIKRRTRSRSIRVALRQRIAGVLSKILHRFKSR